MRTNDLRALVKSKLQEATGLTAVYFEIADAEALYPVITFSFDSADLNDFARHDYRIYVDIWDRGESDSQAEQLADKVEDAFNNSNAPQDTILPTFFLENRRSLLDEDKLIRHKQIELVAQNYEV